MMNEEETLKDCVHLANHLIKVLKLPLPEVSSLRNLKNNMFNMMFESVFHLPVPDHIKHPKTVEDEAHNVQAVIDAISLDILTISLSHITGEDVVSGNVYAVYNLLEIFEGILLYMSDIPASTQSIPKDEVVIEDETSRLVICQVKDRRDSKSDDDICETEEDKRKNTFARRLSRSFEEIFVPSDVLPEISGGLFKGSHGSLRKMKRKTKRMPIRVSKPPSPKAGQKVTQEVKGPTVASGRESESIEDIGSISLHDTTGQRSGTREESITQETIPKLLKPTESEVLAPELPVPSSEFQKETVEELYARNLETKIRIYLDENQKQRKLAVHTEKAFLKTVKTPVPKKTTSAYRRSYLSPLHRRGRSVRRPKGMRTTSTQPSVKSKDSSAGTEKEAAFLQELREEFPGMQMTPVTVRRMKQRYEKQLRIMHKNVAEALHRKSRSQLQVEEAAKRQAILSDILRKETRQEQHKKNLNEHKEFQIRMKAAYNEARQQSLRVKNYYEEFYNQMKKRLQQRSTQEEVLLRHVFEKGIDIEKEQVRELLQYVKEKQEKDAADQKIYLDALENFYQTQLALVTESLAIERCDLEQRLKAQKQVIHSLKRDRRRHLKQEVRRLQDDIASDKDGFHFRELDAEKYVESLRDKYSTRFTRLRK